MKQEKHQTYRSSDTYTKSDKRMVAVIYILLAIAAIVVEAS